MSKETTHCLGIAAFIIVIVIVYMWYDGQLVVGLPTISAAPATSSFTAKKKGFSEGELDAFLNNKKEGMEDYDPSGTNVNLSEINSHQNFVDTALSFASGTNSTDVLRDDTQEINKRWGLNRVDYTSVFSGDDARTVSSEAPEQLKQRVGKYVI